MNDNSRQAKLISFFLIYGLAVVFVALALGLNLFMWTFVKTMVSPLFLLAVVFMAWKYGMSSGLFTAAISGITIDYYFIEPQYQLSGSWDDIVRLVVFMIEAYVLCWLITWRTNATEQIEESRKQLMALTLRQNSLREEERKRIALEIHDELGQALTGLKMEMHLINKQIKEIDSPDKSLEASKKIEDLGNLVDSTILTVRRISTELRPPILDDLGLIAAIEWQTREFQRRTGITCVFSTNIEEVKMESDFSTAVFRIFQETLTNIIRHAEAHTITVMLKKLDKKLILQVEDDGKGIKEEEIKHNNSLGILGMRERARIIGGELKVFNGKENGTVILLSAPLLFT